MTVWLAAAAIVVAAGAIAAMAAAEPRLGLVGLAAALIGAALLADPLPSPAVLGVRLTAALLAVAMLRAAAPPPAARRVAEEPDHDGRSRLGWPSEVLFGAAGGAAGLAIVAALPAFVPVVGDPGGPSGIGHAGVLSAAGVAFGLGSAIEAVALPAVAAGGVGPRHAAAAVLLTQGAILLRIGLAGPPGVVEEIVLGVLLIAVAAVAALLASVGRAVPEGGAHLP